MATESVSSASLPLRPSAQAVAHPLAPLTGSEIHNASSLIKAQWPSGTDLHFKAVTLQEPSKADTVPFLEAEFHGWDLPQIERKVFVNYYLRSTVRRPHQYFLRPVLTRKQNKFHEAVVNLSTQSVEYNVRLGKNEHAPIDGEEILRTERAVIEDEQVQAELAKLKLPEGAKVVCDPWIYGIHPPACKVIRASALTVDKAPTASATTTASSKPFSTCATRSTPMKQTRTTTPCRSPFPQSSTRSA